LQHSLVVESHGWLPSKVIDILLPNVTATTQAEAHTTTKAARLEKTSRSPDAHEGAHLPEEGL